MQKLILAQTNRVFLDTKKSVDSVKISLVDSTGSYLKDSGSNDLKEKVCTLDAPSGKFYYDVTFDSTTTATDAFIYWEATKDSLAVTLEDKFSPEDAVIVAAISTDRLLVSPSFILDNFLRGISESEIEESFAGQSYRQTIRDYTYAATEQLEEATLTSFTARSKTAEKHEYYMTEIYEKFWTIQLYEYPIISITKIQLLLNEQEIATIPAEWIQVGNALEGLVKIVPYAGGISGFAFRLITKGGLGLAILLGESTYVPDFFSYDYSYGLDWANLPIEQKRNIQMAIGRRLAINLLPNLDIHRGISSESRSDSGASGSRSYTSSAMYGEHSAAIETFKKEEMRWINLFKRKYLKRLQVEGY